MVSLWHGIGKKISLITIGGINMTTFNFSMWWQQRGMHEKFILAFVLVFVLQTLLPFLFDFNESVLIDWFSLSGAFALLFTKPWSLFSYALFHASFSHIFWNMIMLYVGGSFFLNLFKPQRFINVFILGVLLGGLIYLLSYSLFPVFSGNRASLIGASGGVMAIFIFICTYMPFQEVRVFFFQVKLWQLGVFLMFIDLIQIPNGNAGGHLAHLGGGALGFYYAFKLKQGTDIGRWFEHFITYSRGWFGHKRSPLKTAHKSSRKKTSGEQFTQAYIDRERQKKIDAILDKISHSGYDSLTKEEKDALFKSGNP